MAEEEKDELLLCSESFPLDEKKERKKLKPIAECHKLLKGVKIDPSQIIYKPLMPEHIDEVKKLHTEWFPIKYEDKLLNEMIVENKGEFFSVAAFYYIQTGENEYKEIILGLLICRWVYTDKIFFEMTSKEVAKDISDNLNYEEEAKCFLSKAKQYYCPYIMSLGVIDECRKMSIGTNMMRSIYNYCIEFDLCVGLYLNVISHNVSGKKFYEKNGMVCLKTIKDFYDIDNKKYDSDVYIKIFTRKEKDKKNQYIYSIISFKEKLKTYLVMKPFYFIIKIFIFIFFLQCFRKKIKTE